MISFNKWKSCLRYSDVDELSEYDARLIIMFAQKYNESNTKRSIHVENIFTRDDIKDCEGYKNP